MYLDINLFLQFWYYVEHLHNEKLVVVDITPTNWIQSFYGMEILISIVCNMTVCK